MAISKPRVLTQVQLKAFVDSGADGAAAVALLWAPLDGLFASRRQWV